MIVLVRHGLSIWNAAGIYQGQSGPGLDPVGHVQATLVAEHLVARFPSIRLIVRSDLVRVAETARPLAERLAVPVLVDERLRELDLGSWVGRPHHEVAASEPEALAAWQAWEDAPSHGGERLTAFRRRTGAALADLRAGADDGTVVVFTHGGVIRMLVGAALGLDPAGEALLVGVANASVTVLECSAPGLRLVTYNETGHLAS